MSFDENWEKQIYRKKRQINNYPFDWVVSSIIKYIPKKKRRIAVELGCGTGNNLEFLSDQNYSKIIGIDGSKSAIKYAREKLKNNNKIELMHADFNEIFFENVDLFLDRGSITHNKKEDIKKIFINILSQLNKGGFFLSSMFCKSHSVYKKNKNNYFSKEMKVKNGIVASFFQEKEIRSLFKNFNLISLVKETKHDKITNNKSSMWNVICKKN
jgi:SAM-dependent methyltransferase